MRILVTGACGWIGSHIVRKLIAAGHEVHAIDRNPDTLRLEDLKSKFQFYVSDLNDLASLQKLILWIRPTRAIHAAWYAAPGSYWTAVENLDCVVASLFLLEALVESGCEKVVGTGTCAEYDWKFGHLVERSTPLNPRGLYGTAKNAVRELFEARLRLAGIGFAWARLFFPYGPGEPMQRLVPSAISGMLNGTGFRLNHGELSRDFIHVDDAAGAICALALSSITGEVNIASGRAVKIGELVAAICDVLGTAEGLEFATDESDEPPMVEGDTARLLHEVGWKNRFTLEEGLVQSCDWWRAHLFPIETSLT
jgi:UDP-glucuronate decarboxylase